MLTALGWAAAGAVLAWLMTLPLHRRSLIGLLASVVLTGTLASVAAVVGNVRAMFISTNQLAAVVSVSVVAGLAAAVSAVVAARRLTRDNRALGEAITAIGQGRLPDTDHPRLTGQVDHLHAELASTAQRLAESRERERALERSRRELIAWVSHDLRTPLAGLRAMSEALEDGVVEQPELYYKQIHAQVDRLTGMVEDLFDLSRIQARGFAIETERISLDDLVSDCLAALEPLARAAEVELRGHSDGQATVTGNAAELNRALTNLVANAIQHTSRRGGVDVHLRIEDGHAVVLVRDQCGGIPQAAMPRVFDVGYRLESARTPNPGQPGGAGLGLAITRGIISAHAGTVDVRNVPGGCEFHLQLPA
ncbi:MAG TPA: HAMP domain-containing sensor histidine kinase [Jatrophihabitans sp.]|nr:HAMP domain-containing sensor histidine kinase [Jatrophihabitans sp.]